MKDPNNPCLFCSTKKDDIIEENQFAYATFDSYPVSNHHSLIIPKRHVKEYFELSEEELAIRNYYNLTGCLTFADIKLINIISCTYIWYQTWYPVIPRECTCSAKFARFWFRHRP